MRFHPTPSEALLFRAIRGGRLGVTFRRQVVLGDFIVDFLARKARLVVEVDGDALHNSSHARDAARDRKITRMGFRVVRIPASVVNSDLARAVAMVREALGT